MSTASVSSRLAMRAHRIAALPEWAQEEVIAALDRMMIGFALMVDGEGGDAAPEQRPVRLVQAPDDGPGAA